MFNKDFAFCIRKDGKVLKENKDSVLIPLGSEYSVRVRNKSRTKCSVDLFVDGKTVIKDVILNADSFVDIPGFHDENAKESRRFRLVSSDNPKVDQPDDSQNGLVEVKIYRELVPDTSRWVALYRDNFTLRCCPQCSGWGSVPHYHPYVYPRSPTHPYPYLTSPYPMWNTTYMGAPNSASSVSSCSSVSSIENVPVYQNPSPNVADVASIPGSIVESPRTSTSFTVDDKNPVCMSLRLIGVKQLPTACSCGHRRKNENFCPNCGTQFFKN